ncbi:hypothetical protein Acr_00g0079970 [Actinidia rufa]|uniref:Uncharacterized protein n=1 Tax=Actinidia rufa TaxID=165716 RepID=A0A7J0DU32_9ERIC|nr:hypothetical protein Acr_00g0079970 [Actinidia rufa]
MDSVTSSSDLTGVQSFSLAWIGQAQEKKLLLRRSGRLLQEWYINFAFEQPTRSVDWMLSCSHDSNGIHSLFLHFLQHSLVVSFKLVRLVISPRNRARQSS